MKTYPLFKVHVPIIQSLDHICKVLESGFINEGVEVTELTNSLQKRLCTNKLILTNSCTSAITLALTLAGVKPGDDVVSTPMTCVATNTPIVNAHANIVWSDISVETGMPTKEMIESVITPKTKAIMLVAWAGTPPTQLDEIHAMCISRKIPLILDAAHAFDAQYDGKQIHEFADYTCYSFQAIKHFTTGDGGALICSNYNDYMRSKSLKWFGLDRDHAKDKNGNWKGQQWDIDIVECGYKFNMNNVSAAIGISQLDHIDHNLMQHRLNANLYDELFSEFDLIKCVKRDIKAKSSHWVYTVTLDDRSNISRDQLLKLLNSEGIMAGVVHVPNDTYTAFSSFKKNLPGVRKFSEIQFSLPCGWWLSTSHIRHIAMRVKELLK